MKRIWIVAAAVALGLLPGCQREGGVPTVVAVRGRVLLPDGTPVRAARVLFYPDGPGGSEAGAELASDGTFVLRTFGDREGAVPGTYKVAVTPEWPSDRPKAEVDAARRSIPQRYWKEQTTDLSAEVRSEGNDLEFRLR